MCPVKVSLNDVNCLNEILSGEIKLALPDRNDLEVSEDDVLEANGNDAKFLQCGVCKFDYKTRDEQVEHYRSKYHNYNLNLYMMKKSPLTLDEFQSIQKMEISSSCSESDEDTRSIAISNTIKTSSSNLKENINKSNKQFGSRLPKFYFFNKKGECFCFYKKLIYNKKNNQTKHEIVSISRDLLTSAYRQVWTVILFNGDNFAAAVFEGDNVVVHKAFHHYVVRAKRGTAQSCNDNAKGGKQNKAKSAGANLRRHNEAKQAADIYELLSNWKETYLDKCRLIFIKIPPYKKEIFTGGKNPIFKKKDPRIRQIPFTTKKPLFSEVVRTHKELYSVTLYDKEAALNLFKHSQNKEMKVNNNETIDQRSLSPNNNVRKRKEKKKQPVYSDPYTNNELQKSLEKDHQQKIKQRYLSTSSIEYPNDNICKNLDENNKKQIKDDENSKENNETLHEKNKKNQLSFECAQAQTNAILFENILPVEEDFLVLLYTSCNSNKLGQFSDLISQKNKSNNLVCKVAKNRIPQLLSTAINTQGDTLLHVVSKSGNNEMIRSLLENGSDPCKRNLNSSLPYSLCPSKSSRSVFIKFRGDFPDKYNYKLAEIPLPLSPEAEERQANKKREKRAARKKKEREKKRNKQVEEKQSDEFCTKEKNKIVDANGPKVQKETIEISASMDVKCDKCGISLIDKIPFKYSTFKLCSTRCVKEHRISNR